MQPFRSIPVEFPGHDGGMLAARLELPEGRVRAYALFAHCFSCSKDVTAAVRISQSLAEQGFGVLRFDFTGLGNSQGDFANTNFSSNIADLVKSADFLRQSYQAPALLVGHSLGGAAVLAAASEVPEARAVATLGAPSDPGHVTHLFADVIPTIEKQGEVAVQLAGRSFRIQRQLLDDLAEQRLLDRVGSLRLPLLIFHAPLDAVVDVAHAQTLFQAAKHPKSFVSLDGSDHMIADEADAFYVADVIAGWVGRYLGETGRRPRPSAVLPDGMVRVSESGESLYSQRIHVGGHLLTADEPASVGGGDLGPGPYDLLLAALGACTTMTLRMYADRKGLPLQRAEVLLRHQKVHAQDCEDCESTEGKVDEIERELHLQGPLDQQQRDRLLEIADKCPVHRTLHSEIKVRTRMT